MLKDHAEDAADGAGMPAESGEPVDNTVSKDSGPEKSDTADSGAAHVAVHNAHERELEDVAAEGLAEKNQRKKPESKAVVRPKAKTEPKKLMTAAKAKTTKGAGAGPKATCKARATSKRQYVKDMTMEEMEKQLHSVAASFQQECCCVDAELFTCQSLHCMI